MKYFLLIYCVVVLACNNESSTATTNDSTNTAMPAYLQADSASAIEVPSCYTLQTSNNLVLLKLNAVSPTISGQLTYEIMGKDKNDGTLSGVMRGDTLFAHYNFMSEGKRSVRQVAFLKKGNAFVEGYADVEQKGDSMIFSTRDTLDFNGSMVLEKVPCP